MVTVTVSMFPLYCLNSQFNIMKKNARNMVLSHADNFKIFVVFKYLNTNDSCNEWQIFVLIKV